jgi:hypothetical protein
VTLKDKEGNFYNIQRASAAQQTTIAPGKSHVDTLLFEPTPPFTQLDLDLPVAGTDKTFQFRTPPGFIARAEVPLQDLPAVAEAPPKAPSAPVAFGPLPPDKDPEVRRSLIGEYREKANDLRQRSMGMETNEARNFRRRKDKEVRKELGKKYKLEPDQVERILREGM